MSNIANWTLYEHLILFCRVILIIASAAFLGSLFRLVRKMGGWRKLDSSGKNWLLMFYILGGNVLFFYLLFILQRPVVSFASLSTLGYIVVFILAVRNLRIAELDEERLNRRIKLPDEDKD